MSYISKRNSKSRGFTKLEDFDLVALRAVLPNKSSGYVNEKCSISDKERGMHLRYRCVRNNWAHCEVVLPGKGYNDGRLFNGIDQFFWSRWNGHKLISEVDVMIEEVKSPSTVDFSTI